MKAPAKLRRRRRDLVGRLCRAFSRPTRQALIAVLAEGAIDVPTLAKSLGQSQAWTRYWLAAFARLKLVLVSRNGPARRRLYRLSDKMSVTRRGDRVTFLFPPLDDVTMEVSLHADSLPIR